MIGNHAFDGCDSLIDFEIPTSIKSVGDNTFQNCFSLERIIIPSSIQSLGNSTFKGCLSLKEIIYSSFRTAINHSFHNFSSLIQVSIPLSVEIIGNNAFQGCSSLVNIMIPSSIKIIGNFAFQVCYSLASVRIPYSVQTIGKFAFEECTSLREVTFDIGSSLSSIGDFAFYGCILLEKINQMPQSIVSIGKSAFEDCYLLRHVIVENELLSLKSIGSFAFKGCKSLSKEMVQFPTQRKDIFEGCPSNRPFWDEFDISPFKNCDRVIHELIAGACIIGEKSVGKTSLIYRFLFNEFNESYPRFDAINLFAEEHFSHRGYGDYYYIKSVTFDGHQTYLRLTDGQNDWSFYVKYCMSPYDLIVLVFDISNKDTFDSLSKLIIEVNEIHKEKVEIVIVGNKCDKNRAVSKEDAETFAMEKNLKYFEVSSFLDLGIEDLFTYIITKSRLNFIEYKIQNK